MRAVLIAALFFFIGWNFADKREYEPTYGKTGLPKNCIAIVQENADGFHGGKYSPVEALSSIERNCGKYGFSLKE